MKTTSRATEVSRLQALGQYNLLDGWMQAQFDDLTRLTARICRAPIALIALVDKERIWFKSKTGFKPDEIPRAGSLWDRTIQQKKLLVIPDTRQNETFAPSPLVVAQSGARFYAGMPLVTTEGHVLGTLSVMDVVPRELDKDQQEVLQILARQVMLLIESSRIGEGLLARRAARAAERKGLHAVTAGKKSEARLSCILDQNLTGISFANLQGVITEANAAFCRMVGCSEDDLSAGKVTWQGITSPSHRYLDETAVKQIEVTGSCAPFETEYAGHDRSVPVLLSASLLSNHQEVVGFSLDLTKFKEAEAKANYLAYHDALTNLPNQALFKDRLHQALTLARRNEQMLAVLLVNLDRFKTINDTLGYLTADQLLRNVADRLAGCLRDSDTVARFSGDEFAILVTQVSRTEDAAKIAESIKDALSAPFQFEDQELFVTTSIGISLCPDDGRDAIALLKNAGTALKRAKERAGNDYQFYASGRTTTALRQLVLENNLRPGLEHEEFILHYQPQVNIQTFKIVGIEALVRWQHPGLGLLYPVEFISIAEHSGLIVSIGEWVLRNACAQSKSWQDAGFEPLRMAVNLSARQFQQPKLVDTIAEILKETGLDPRYLELELTEGSIMKDPDEAIGKLHELKGMGVKISIDDFGTGYSSLNYLKRFPIDTLKIDQSFVSELNTDPDDAAIVTAIITLAHALKLNVIAEGVETKEQLGFLRRLHCDEVQGYLFAKGISAEEFTELLMQRHGLNTQLNYDTNPLPSLHTLHGSLNKKAQGRRQ